MALRAVDDHPKLARLKSLLACGRGEAMGYLEALWHFAGRYTPQGDIGKYSDAEIEAWIEWRGEPGKLMASIAMSGWIDACSTHRLLVHHWHDHADDATRLALKRKKLDFLSRCPDSVPTVSGLPEPEPEPEPEPVKQPTVAGGSRKQRTPKAPITPVEIVAEFKAMAAYSAVNVQHESDKCIAWCEVHHQSYSRGRFLKWLNRIDMPVNGKQQEMLKDEPYLPRFK